MIKHFEKYLGKISSGWVSEGSNVQAILFKNQPFKDVSTYSTLGLSKHVLKINQTKEVRQELLISVYEKYESKNIASSLITFAEHIIETKKSLLRGEVIGPGTPIINGSQFVGVYCSIPAFFEDEFSVNYELTPPVVVVWLIPLYNEEIEYVKSNGWENFETILENKEPDFWDINRSLVI